MKKEVTEQDLFDLKEKIDNSKTRIDQLTGQKQALMKQLKNEWACNSLQDAEKKLVEMEAQATKLEKTIEEETKKLQEQYNFE